MTRKATPKKAIRTVADKDRLRQVREQFQRERPSLKSLAQSGEYDVIPQGDYLSLMQAFAQLKKARQQRKLSLADIAKRSGIDKAALSRLENGINSNPTFLTLESIASAIGVSIRIVVEDQATTAR